MGANFFFAFKKVLLVKFLAVPAQNISVPKPFKLLHNSCLGCLWHFESLFIPYIYQYCSPSFFLLCLLFPSLIFSLVTPLPPYCSTFCLFLPPASPLPLPAPFPPPAPLPPPSCLLLPGVVEEAGADTSLRKYTTRQTSDAVIIIFSHNLTITKPANSLTMFFLCFLWVLALVNSATALLGSSCKKKYGSCTRHGKCHRHVCVSFFVLCNFLAWTYTFL